MHLRALATLALASLPLFAPAAVRAQDAPALVPTRPYLRWETIETPHFAFHFPTEMRAWTIQVAERVESVHDAVVALVGYGPAARVNVVVDDPFNVANGSAYPFIGAPAIVLWPVPPEPTDQIGDNRSWGEILAVHEFAHVAHISRPTRNAGQRLLWSLAPLHTGPILRHGSRWLWEGYATYVEGKLTGSGRPHGAWRPALLRELALEGQLPTYSQLNAVSGYRAGSYAYLVGSAYLEWLAQQRGDSSLVHLWRRMTARQVRSFDAAFVGVYGDSPAAMYGRFTAEVTGKALRLRDELAAAGPAPGEMVQRLAWRTGDPTLSRDGKLVALQLRSRDEPARVVVWKTDSEPESEAARKARRRLLERDPQDVPAIRVYPRPKRAVATLPARGGRAFREPRFFADGRRLLLVRDEPTGDGAVRPDLWVWDHEHRDLRRITHRAAIREADPAPDGRTAVGTRCLAGTCDLVRVDLARGSVAVIAAGTPTLVYDRPRWSPDGRTIAYDVQDSTGFWHVGVMDASGAGARVVDPRDSVNRYDPTFTADGRSLVVVSEAGGIPNLARLDVETGAMRPLTRVTGAAWAPATSTANDTVYFLSEHASGVDLFRVSADSASPVTTLVASDTVLAPAAKVPVVPRPAFAVRPVGAPRPYGLGPREHSWFLAHTTAPEGSFSTVAIVGTDPAGRLGYTLQGALDPFGDLGSWRGGALNVELRRFRPLLRGDLFYAIDQPSRQRAGTFAPAALDAIYEGGTFATLLSRDYGDRRLSVSLGASLGALRGDTGSAARRGLGFAQVGAGYLVGRGSAFASARASFNGSAGRTGDANGNWQRALATARLAAGDEDVSVSASGTYGAVSRGAAPFEQFVVGGVRPPLFDDAILSQRVSLPAAPLGVRGGRELYAYRVAVDAAGVLSPYFTAVSTEGGFAHAFRVVGLETDEAIASTPVARLPGLRVQTGVGYSLDAPYKYKTRVYVAMEIHP